MQPEDASQWCDLKAWVPVFLSHKRKWIMLSDVCEEASLCFRFWSDCMCKLEILCLLCSCLGVTASWIWMHSSLVSWFGFSYLFSVKAVVHRHLMLFRRKAQFLCLYDVIPVLCLTELHSQSCVWSLVGWCTSREEIQEMKYNLVFCTHRKESAKGAAEQQVDAFAPAPLEQQTVLLESNPDPRTDSDWWPSV